MVLFKRRRKEVYDFRYGSLPVITNDRYREAIQTSYFQTRFYCALIKGKDDEYEMDR